MTNKKRLLTLLLILGVSCNAVLPNNEEAELVKDQPSQVEQSQTEQPQTEQSQVESQTEQPEVDLSQALFEMSGGEAVAPWYIRAALAPINLVTSTVKKVDSYIGKTDIDPTAPVAKATYRARLWEKLLKAGHAIHKGYRKLTGFAPVRYGLIGLDYTVKGLGAIVNPVGFAVDNLVIPGISLCGNAVLNLGVDTIMPEMPEEMAQLGLMSPQQLKEYEDQRAQAKQTTAFVTGNVMHFAKDSIKKATQTAVNGLLRLCMAQEDRAKVDDINKMIDAFGREIYMAESAKTGKLRKDLNDAYTRQGQNYIEIQKDRIRTFQEKVLPAVIKEGIFNRLAKILGYDNLQANGPTGPLGTFKNPAEILYDGHNWLEKDIYPRVKYGYGMFKLVKGLGENLASFITTCYMMTNEAYYKKETNITRIDHKFGTAKTKKWLHVLTMAQLAADSAHKVLGFINTACKDRVKNLSWKAWLPLAGMYWGLYAFIQASSFARIFQNQMTQISHQKGQMLLAQKEMSMLLSAIAEKHNVTVEKATEILKTQQTVRGLQVLDTDTVGQAKLKKQYAVTYTKKLEELLTETNMNKVDLQNTVKMFNDKNKRYARILNLKYDVTPEDITALNNLKKDKVELIRKVQTDAVKQAKEKYGENLTPKHVQEFITEDMKKEINQKEVVFRKKLYNEYDIAPGIYYSDPDLARLAY